MASNFTSGIWSFLNKAKDIGSSVLTGVEKGLGNLGGNILTQFTGSPKPQPRSNQGVSSGPNQNYSPDNRGNFRNPTIPASFQPTQSTPYGPADSSGTLINPNTALPGGSSRPFQNSPGATTPPQIGTIPNQPNQGGSGGSTTRQPVDNRKSHFTIPEKGTNQQPVQIFDQGAPGASSYQFGGGGISTITGGAQNLPSSLSNPSASGGVSYPTVLSQEELRKRKGKIADQSNHAVDTGGNLFNDLLGINTAQASTGADGKKAVGQGDKFSFLNKGQSDWLGRMSGGAMNTGNKLGQPLSIPSSSGYGLNAIQSSLLNIIGKGGPASKTTDPSKLGSKDFKTGGGGSKDKLKPTDTKSAHVNKIVERSKQVLETSNQHNAQIVSDIHSSVHQATVQETIQRVGGYVRATDPSGQINVAKVNPDGSQEWVSPDMAKSAGLDIMNLPDATQWKDAYDKGFTSQIEKVIDPTTGMPRISTDKTSSTDPKDVPNPEEAAKIKAQQDADNKAQAEADKFREKATLMDPVNYNNARDKKEKDLGLTSLKNSRYHLEDAINLIVGGYDTLAEEIKNDPDFSQKMKAKKFAWQDSEKQRVLAGFERDLSLLNEKISNGQDEANQFMTDFRDAHTANFAEWKDLQTEADKASTEDKGWISTILTNYGGGGLPPTAKKAIEGVLHDKSLINVIDGMITIKEKQLQIQGQKFTTFLGTDGLQHRGIVDLSTDTVQDLGPSGTTTGGGVSSGGKTSAAAMRGKFIDWIAANNGVFTSSQLKDVAAKIDKDLAKDPELGRLISEYSGSGGFLGFGKSDTLDPSVNPQESFNSFSSGKSTSPSSSGGSQTYTVTSPDGSDSRSMPLTRDQIQKYKDKGYKVQ